MAKNAFCGFETGACSKLKVWITLITLESFLNVDKWNAIFLLNISHLANQVRIGISSSLFQLQRRCSNCREGLSLTELYIWNNNILQYKNNNIIIIQDIISLFLYLFFFFCYLSNFNNFKFHHIQLSIILIK